MNRDSLSSSPLHEAAARGWKPIIRHLVGQGADIDSIWMGRTPLMWAAMGSRAKTVHLLIRLGADVNRRGHEEGFPLRSVVMFGTERKSAVICRPTTRRNMVVATIRFLVEAGADINCTDWLGSSALTYAAKDGDAELVRLLLSLGAAVNVVSKDGITPLSVATALLGTARRWPGDDPAPYAETIQALRAAGATQ